MTSPATVAAWFGLWISGPAIPLEDANERRPQFVFMRRLRLDRRVYVLLSTGRKFDYAALAVEAAVDPVLDVRPLDVADCLFYGVKYEEGSSAVTKIGGVPLIRRVCPGERNEDCASDSSDQSLFSSFAPDRPSFAWRTLRLRVSPAHVVPRFGLCATGSTLQEGAAHAAVSGRRVLTVVEPARIE